VVFRALARAMVCDQGGSTNLIGDLWSNIGLDRIRRAKDFKAKEKKIIKSLDCLYRLFLEAKLL